VKSGRLQWTGHVALKKKNKGIRVFVWKPLGKCMDEREGE
jgi:hypothetical protein